MRSAAECGVSPARQLGGMLHPNPGTAVQLPHQQLRRLSRMRADARALVRARRSTIWTNWSIGWTNRCNGDVDCR